MALSILLGSLSTGLWAQSFEASLSAGASQIGGADIGAVDAQNGIKATLDSGFHLAARMTFNTHKYTGFEIGYAYNRAQLGITGSGSQGMAVHQGFGDVLLYARPDEARIRPFAAGGVHFSNFVPPGQSAQYGQGENKFGINYGAGVKMKVTGPWQVRFDFRQYNTGKPFGLPGVSGRLLQNEFSAGVGYTL